MVDQSVFQIVTGVAGTAVLFILNSLWNMLREQQRQSGEFQKQIGDMAVKLAEGYVPRAELEKTFERVFEAQEKTNQVMQNGFADLHREITHIIKNQAQSKALYDSLVAHRHDA